jgi:5'-deoxynucleotidase
MVPDALKKDFEPLLLGAASAADDEHRAIVKAADKLCAYVKCLEEIAAGNHEFTWAEKSLREAVEAIDRPEVRYFLETFAPSFRLTLDELT